MTPKKESLRSILRVARDFRGYRQRISANRRAYRLKEFLDTNFENWTDNIISEELDNSPNQNGYMILPPETNEKKHK